MLVYPRFARPWLFALVGLGLGCAGSAQTVYRCGSTYKPSPCEGASLVHVEDSRTAEQRQDAKTAATRDATAADTLESARRKQERDHAAQDKAARRLLDVQEKAATRATALANEATAQREKKNKKAKKQPEFFTATSKQETPKKPAKP